MSARWIFRELRRGDKDRQPTQGEFFSSDAIDSLAKALVRESIQNSLDASPKEEPGLVRVRFHIGSVNSSTAKRYFNDGWKHFSAEDNGLDDPPEQSEACRFLLVEDFGTTGLTGNVEQWRYEPGVENPFYYFFRTEGRSGKNENERGRWGIGKYVFPRSSRIHAFLALTLRHDDGQRLLMGQAVLKSHGIGEEYYTPDGNYGQADNDDFVTPAKEASVLDQFERDFTSKRSNLPGLSVLVPWVDQDITREAILRAVIEDYFFPVLSGDLEVTVSEGELEVTISSANLDSVAKELDVDFANRMRPLIALTNWARTQTDETITRLKPADTNRPKWEAALVPEEKLLELREKYREGKPIALTLPLTTRQKGKAPQESFFRVFLVNDGAEHGRPVFIRDGIIIPGIKDQPVNGCRSIVLISDPPLAKLLGDSENPAHTEWQKDSEHFRNKYVYGKSYIDFVTYAVSKFVRALNESDEQPNQELLQDIFFVPKKPATNEPKDKSRPRKRNKGEVIPPDPKPEPVLKRFTLSRIAGGFTITQGAKGSVAPSALSVAVAYDRRRGSALKKYAPMDFQLEAAPIVIETEAAIISDRAGNRMIARPSAPEFKIKVTGFDENRDLYIDVRAKEIDNDPKA
ncbi:MAG: hypothetical protein JNM31_07745 [Flavobacteriales bacterium]|nr:hypothetical protein [Flavobacteriales bacterium]